MKIKLVYNGTKPQLTDRMKKYATWTFQKIDLDKFPTYKQSDGDVVIDYAYLFDMIKDEDGIMAVVEGDRLKGVFGTQSTYRGKQIMQVEAYPNKFRRWTQNRITKLWSLRLSSKGDYPATQYVMEHELGHALCDFWHENDELHAWIKLKKFDEWWDYKDFVSVNILEDSTQIEWQHPKSGAKITPKCYILHTDLGTEKSTRDVIVNSPKSVSYNLYINKKGEKIEYVVPGWEAWHAGVVHNPTPEAKKFFGNKNPNSMSIGICFEGRGEDANEAQFNTIQKIINDDPLPIFAHKEITDYKPQSPLNLKRRLEIKKPPLSVVIRLIQLLQKLGIIS